MPNSRRMVDSLMRSLQAERISSQRRRASYFPAICRPNFRPILNFSSSMRFIRVKLLINKAIKLKMVNSD